MRILLLFLIVLSTSLALAQDSKVFVFLNSKPDKENISEEETAALMKLHLANIEKMVVDGKLLVAGPFDGGGGIFIFDTDDVSLTNTWLQADPAVKANRWDIDIFKIDFKKGGACLASEPYEMVTYGFLRVNFINDIANYKLNNVQIPGWNEVAKMDSIIAVGRFPQYDGGIIIYKGSNKPVYESSFSKDQVSIEQKIVWVARGSFCE